jgi:hypothetical protein
LEILIVIVTLLKHFEFSLPTDGEEPPPRIYRRPSGLMMPMVEGQMGAWMGLIIKPIN